MRTLLFFLALSTATAQTAKVAEDDPVIQEADKLLPKQRVEVEEIPEQSVEYRQLMTTASFVFSTPTERELGGVTPTGQFYLVIWKDGKRIEKPCSRRALIKAVEKSNMASAMKMTALRALGKPAGITVYAPDREEKP